MENKLIIGIIVVIALISVFVGTVVYTGKVIEEGYHYTYKGVDGSDYAFDVIRLEGVKGIFNQVTFSLGRDDGKIYKYSTLFRNSPMDLENIPLENCKDNLLYTGEDRKSQIYITQDINLPGNSSKTSTVSAMDISKITNGMANVYIYAVPTELTFTSLTEDLKSQGLKEIDCKDATKDIAVIKIQLGKENKIYRENENCVVLEAKSYDDITKLSDKFIMHLIGIF